NTDDLFVGKTLLHGDVLMWLMKTLLTSRCVNQRGAGQLHWAVTTGGFDSETVQDVMPGAVERRFGSELPASPVEWLTDNGSCYRANETRQFARMLGLEPKNTAVRSPESNGIAESFVKTIKRDYISIMPKPDGLTAAKNLAEAFEHYNEWHPHSALGYRSPREYLRQRASNGLSDNRCLEI
uniref:integrase core domain-containing protein n=1 Tax=Raoultella ornithinolytica TaxID=54291 RepID=UPI003F573577